MSNWASERAQLVKDCEAREERRKINRRALIEPPRRQIEGAQSENERLRQDAARYQWLRSGASMAQVRGILNDTPHGIDAAIDAAMREEHDEL